MSYIYDSNGRYKGEISNESPFSRALGKLAVAAVIVIFIAASGGKSSTSAQNSAGAYYCVSGVPAWDTLDVRRGPSFAYGVSFTLSPGQRYLRTTETYESGGTTWAKIVTNAGDSGWVNSAFLQAQN